MNYLLPEVADLMGFQAREAASPIGMIAKIEEGRPVDVLERLSKLISPSDASFITLKIVSKATLARRKNSKTQRLTRNESDHLTRLAKVWSIARQTWGSDDEARSFLFRPHPLLKNQRPIEVALNTEFGGNLVEDIIGRLRYGSVA